MTFLNKIVNFEYESEYANEYDLTLKPKFSTPKIQSYKGNLNKRWYLYYSYRNPETGKMKRLSPIYGSANKFKTKEDRMTILTGHRRILLRLLKQGFNPFIDNTELYNSLYNTQPKPITIISQKEVAIALVVEEVTGMEYTKALEFVLNQKIKLISDSGKSTFVSRIKDFELWIKETHPELKSITLVNRKIILAYLNHILDRTSARTRNNYKADLSSVFQVLEDNEIISKNVVKGIPSLKTKPTRNKTYTLEQQEEIFDYLVNVDPILLLYIKFISYNLLRPIEVCRLQMKDIDFKGKNYNSKQRTAR